MAKNERLTKEQCKELHNILASGLENMVLLAIKYSIEHSYSVSETIKFIASFLYAFTDNDMFTRLFTNCLTLIASGVDDGTKIHQIIDFPNSDMNSENNKSSDTKNTER